jgi:hypothetical protein
MGSINIQTRNNIFLFFAILFICSSSLSFFSFITADPDLWGHLTFGKEIWTTRSIPRFDIYSYTAFGMKWINHEWMSELFMWLLYDTFGSPGLLIMKSIIGLIAVGAIFIVDYNRKNYFINSIIVFLLAVIIISPGFMTRPHVATLLFTSLFFLFIHLYLEKRIRLLWVLPLIMILWANSHGGFVIGAGILPIIIFLEYIDCLIKRKDCRHIRYLLLWAVVTEFSTLVNPYGIHLLTFLYRTLTLQHLVIEWAPVSLFDFSFIETKVFALVVMFSFFVRKDKNRFWEIGIIISSIIFAFLHQRHTPILAIFAAPFLSEKLTYLFEKTGLIKISDLSYFRFVFVILLTAIIGFQILHTSKKYIDNAFNIIADPNVYPKNALNFIKINNIRGNILLPFDWGEDAIWHLYPDNKVSIDGRYDTVYPKNITDDQLNGSMSEEKWEELINKYPTDIILSRRTPYAIKLIKERQNWIYIYSDMISIIFLKNNENNKEIIQRFKNKNFIYPKEGASLYFP